MYHAQLAGHYTFAVRHRRRAELPLPERLPLRRVVPDGTVGLNVCNFGCAFFSQNLDQNRSESVHLLNFRIDKSVPLGGSRKATLMLDVYNILNSDPVTNFNLLLGPTYKTVIAVLDPRVFQLGFRFEF